MLFWKIILFLDKVKLNCFCEGISIDFDKKAFEKTDVLEFFFFLVIVIFY